MFEKLTSFADLEWNFFIFSPVRQTWKEEKNNYLESLGLAVPTDIVLGSLPSFKKRFFHLQQSFLP